MGPLILFACAVYLLYVALNPAAFADGDWYFGLGFVVIGWLLTKFKSAQHAGSVLIVVGIVSTLLAFIGVRYHDEITDIATALCIGLLLFGIFWLAFRIRRRRQNRTAET